MNDKKKPMMKNAKEEAQTLLDKTAAKAEQAKGAVKAAVGKATDNTRLQAEGKIDQAKGKVKEEVARAKDAAHDTAEKLQKNLHKKH